MPDTPSPPTARERAEKLAIQYAAEDCLFAATDAIEAALTAARLLREMGR